MKKYSILKAILLVMLFVIVCTWVFPNLQFSQYTGELVEGSKVQVGLFNIPNYFLETMNNFGNMLLIIFAIGAFYGVAYKIPAYRELLDRIVERFKGKEKVFLAAIMIFVAVLTSVTGLSIEMLFVFPFIISLVLLMGYNKLVAASTTIGSVIVGLMGNTLGSQFNYYINYFLGTKYSNEMSTKILILVIALAILIYNVIQYATKIKNDTDKVLEYVPAGLSTTKEVKVVKEEKEVKEKVEVKATVSKAKKETKPTKKPTTKKKAPAKKSTKTKANDLATNNVVVAKNSKKAPIWPFVVIFDLIIAIIALSTFDWTTVANTSWPTDALKAIKDFDIDGFPIISKILGNVNEFGAWTSQLELPLAIIALTCFLGIAYRVKFDKFLEGFTEGMKKAVKPAFYIFLAYVVLVMVVLNPFQLHITKFFLEMAKGLNVITMTIVVMISSVLNVDIIYAAQGVLPYSMTVITDSTLYPILSVIFQSVYGLTMLVAPTSIILLATLSYLDIPYTQWLKHIWKLFLELLVVLVLIFFVLIVV